MTRSRIVLGAGMAAMVLAHGGAVRAQGLRLANVGATTVVLARLTGRVQPQTISRPAASAQFRPLSVAAKAAVQGEARQPLPVASSGRLTQLPGGIALVRGGAAQATRSEPLARTVVAVVQFRPLAAQAKAAIVQAGAEPGTSTPPPTPTEAPFTLSLATLSAAGRAFLQISDLYIIGGLLGNMVGLTTGNVVLLASGTKASQYMIHFQVLSASFSAFDYTVTLGDGSNIRVPARLGSLAQDIVVMLNLTGGQTLPTWGSMARLQSDGSSWYFIGVQVTPM